MIVYKNLFPRDFVDLQKKKGYVHFLLSKKGKEAFVSERNAELEEAAADCKRELESIKTEIFMKTKELAWAIIGTRFNNSIWGRCSLSNDNNMNLDELELYIQDERGINQDARDEYKRRKAIIEADRKGQIDSKTENWKISISRWSYWIQLLFLHLHLCSLGKIIKYFCKMNLTTMEGQFHMMLFVQMGTSIY